MSELTFEEMIASDPVYNPEQEQFAPTMPIQQVGNSQLPTFDEMLASDPIVDPETKQPAAEPLTSASLMTSAPSEEDAKRSKALAKLADYIDTVEKQYTDPNQYEGSGDEFQNEYLIERTPFVGGIYGVYDAEKAAIAAKRIERQIEGENKSRGWADFAKSVVGGGVTNLVEQYLESGEATDDDYVTLARYIVKNQRNAELRKEQGWGSYAFDLATRMPSQALEFVAGMPAFKSGQKAGQQVVEKIAGEVAEGAAKGLARRAVEALPGTIAQTAAMPTVVGERAAELTADKNIQAAFDGTKDAEGLLENVPEAFARVWPEVASEHVGGAFGEVLSKVPLPKRVESFKRAVFDWWRKEHPKGTTAQFFGELLEHSGYHGAIPETLEERVSEVLSAGMGLEPWSNITTPMTEEGRAQLLAEMVAFAVPGAAHKAGSTAFDRAQQWWEKDNPSRQDIAAAGISGKFTQEQRREMAEQKRNEVAREMDEAVAGDPVVGEQSSAGPTETAAPTSEPTITATQPGGPGITQAFGTLAGGGFSDGLIDSVWQSVEAGNGIPAIERGTWPGKMAQLAIDRGYASRDAIEQAMRGAADILTQYPHGPERLARLNAFANSTFPKQGAATTAPTEQAMPQAVKPVGTGELTPQPLLRSGLPHSAPQPGEIGIGTTEIPAAAEQQGDASGISPDRITREFARLFKIPIRSGRIRGGEMGHYKPGSMVVRTKEIFSNDIGVLAHEVAHHIDFTTGPKVTGNASMRPATIPAAAKSELKKLDYDQTEQRTSEGAAEFLRLWLTDETAARDKAPQYFDWFEKTWLPSHVSESAKLQYIKGLVQQWKDQGSVKRAMARVDERPGMGERLRDTPEWLRDKVLGTEEKWYDRLAILRHADDAAIAAGYEPQSGETMAHPLASHFSQTERHQAANAIENGIHTVSQGQPKTLTEPLTEVFDELESPEEYNLWRVFAWARQTLEEEALTGGDTNTGMDPRDAKEIVRQVAANPEQQQRLERTHKRFTAFSNGILKLAEDSGVIPAGLADHLVDKRPMYFPLERVASKESAREARRMGHRLVHAGEFVKVRRGSGAAILDPVDTMTRRLVEVYRRAMDLEVLKQLDRELVPESGGKRAAKGMGELIEHVPTPLKKFSVPTSEAGLKVLEEISGSLTQTEREFLEEVLLQEGGSVDFYRPNYQPVTKDQTFTYFVGGQARTRKVNARLWNTLMGMNKGEQHIFVDLLHRFWSKPMRLGATGLNPNFWAKNMLFFDYFANYFQSKHQSKAESLHAPFLWLSQYGLSEANRMLGRDANEIVELWKSSGGEIAGTHLGMDRNSLAKARQRIVPTSKGRKVAGTILDAPNTLRQLLSFSDVGPRLAEFAASLKNDGYVLRDGKIYNEATKNFEQPPRDVVVKASLAAADVTTNFKRMGTYAEQINRVWPFFNAGVQGSMKAIRTLRDAAKGGDQSRARVAIGLSALMTATAIYWAFRRDDEDYVDEAPWLKYGYWNWQTGGYTIRVPKPREYAVFINALEASLNQMSGSERDEMADAIKLQLESQMPGSGVAGVNTALHIARDRDAFDRPIEGSLERQERAYRYTDRTTGIARYLGANINANDRDIPGTSPVQIDQMLDELTGGQWKRWVAPKTGERTLRDVPGLGGMLLDYHDSQPVRDFYDARDRIDKKYTTVRIREGEDAIPPELKREHQRLEAYNELISQIRNKSYEKQSRADREDLMGYVVGLARSANNLKRLESYQSPFSADEFIPDEVKEIRDDWLGRKLVTATAPKPTKEDKETTAEFNARVERWQERTEPAQDLLREIGAGELGKDYLKKLLQARTRKNGNRVETETYNSTTRQHQTTSYGRRLNALDGLAL